MHFICRPFIAKNNHHYWSQYWENEPDDFQLKSTKGHLFGLITLNSQQEKEEDIKTIGHDLIFEINQSYFAKSEDGSKPVDILTHLQNTLKSLLDNPLYQDYQFEIVLSVILKNQVFIASLGNNHVILNRQSQISLLLSESSNPEASPIKVISGAIQDQDRLFLANDIFFKQITWPKIKDNLSDQNLKNIEENFLSLLYSVEGQNNLAALLVEIKEDLPTDPSQSTESDHSSLETPSPTPQQNSQQDQQSSSQDSPASSMEYQLPKASKKSLFSFLKNKNSSIFVDDQNHSQHLSKRKKIQISLAVFLLLALFVSSYFGYQKNKKIKTEENYQQLKSYLTQHLDQALNFKSLDLETSQSKAKEAEKVLQQMVDLEVHPDEINQFKSQIDTLLSQTGLKEDFDPDFFYDTANITSSPNYQNFSLSNGAIYLFDPSNGRLDQLIIKDKPNKTISKSDNLKEATTFVGGQDKFYFLTNDEISLLDKKEDTLEEKITLSDSDPVPNVTDLQIWNGSIYILDHQEQTLWKYTPSADSFSSAQNWLKNDKKLSLGPISLDIDGKIWILYQNGQVENYLSGVKDNFSLKGDQDFNQASNLTVSLEDDSYLAFLDGSKTIFVYKKDGEFIAKYQLTSIEALDILFDDNILYILANDQKIYQIKL